MKKIIGLTTALAGLLIISGCSLYGGTSSPNTSAVQVAPNTINIQNLAFNPGTLTVKKGTAVIWTNNDSAVHQIKSANFNSGQLSNGQSFSFTFNSAGTFDYSCAIHPSMLGKIIVE